MPSLRRTAAVPVVGLAVLLATPGLARADQGGSGNSGRNGTIVPTNPPNTVSSSGDGPSTTSAAPSTTVVAPSTTRPGRNGGIELTGFLDQLIAKVNGSSLSADAKAALLGRLQAARDAATAGTPLGNGDMQQLLRDVYTALQVPPGTDAPRPSTTLPPVVQPTLPPSPSTTAAPRNPSGDSQKILAQLDELSAKVTASSLADGDKATLLAAIDRLRQAVNSGSYDKNDLATIRTVVKAALEQRAPVSTTTTTPLVTTLPGETTTGPTATSPVPTTEAPAGGDHGRRPKGADAVTSAIDLVTNSPLSDELKQQIVAVLVQAKSVIEDTTLTPEQATAKLRELLEAEKAQRLAVAAAKLTLFSQKIATLAFDAASLPGAPDMIVAVHDELAQANDLLATVPLDIDTIKAAWQHLHDARTMLQQFLESAGATTTSAP